MEIAASHNNVWSMMIAARILYEYRPMLPPEGENVQVRMLYS
jgi:hypothetical protein